MKNTLKLLLPSLALTLVSVARADIPECVNANPVSVDDVHRCISRIPSMSMLLGSAGNNFQGCNSLKLQILSAQKSVPDERQKVPTCRTLGDVLTKLNGKRPVWYDCADYDGSQKTLNKCLVPMLTVYSRGQDLRAFDCLSIRATIPMALMGTTDDLNKVSRNVPSCDMITKAYAANGLKMNISVCDGYKPGDTAHLQRCLQPAIAEIKAQSNRSLSCDDARKLHNMLLTHSYGKLPDNYSIPACSEIDPVVAKLMNAPAPAKATPSAQAQAQARPANTGYDNNSYPDNAYSNTGTSSDKELRRQAKREERQQQIQTGASVAGQVLNGGGLAPIINNLPAASAGNPASSKDLAKQQKREQKMSEIQGNVEAAKGLLEAFGRK